MIAVLTVDVRDARALRTARYTYRKAGERLSELAIMLRAAGEIRRSVQAARAADRAFRAAIAEERDPEPRR